MAAQGYDLLADALEAAWTSTGRFLDVGVAYVGFAVGHRAHFEVMFRPDLLHPDDPTLRTAKARATAVLYDGAAAVPAEQRGDDGRLAGIAGWSLVHGLATLWHEGALPPDLQQDPEAAARAVAARLFAPE